MRRDGVDDFMLVDGDGLRILATPSGACTFVPLAFVFRDTGERLAYVVDQSSIITVELDSASFNRTAIEAGFRRGIAVGLVVWARDTSEGPFVVDSYLPETVATIAIFKTALVSTAFGSNLMPS